jgi:hypothetical protein
VWDELCSAKGKARRRLSYDWFVLALDLLFLTDVVALRDGLLTKSRTAV